MRRRTGATTSTQQTLTKEEAGLGPDPNTSKKPKKSEPDQLPMPRPRPGRRAIQTTLPRDSTPDSTEDPSSFAEMTLDKLVAVYMNYIKDIKVRITNIRPPSETIYYVWASKSPRDESPRMMGLRLDIDLINRGIVMLVPIQRDYQLPSFPDETKDKHRLFQLIIKTNAVTSREFNEILCVSLLCEHDYSASSDVDGLYEVSVVLSDSTGIRAYFNSPERTLGRVEFHIDDSSTLPTWYLKYMAHMGYSTEAVAQRRSRELLTEMLASRYRKAQSLAQAIPAPPGARGALRAPPTPMSLSSTSTSSSSSEPDNDDDDDDEPANPTEAGETSSNSAYTCIIS